MPLPAAQEEYSFDDNHQSSASAATQSVAHSAIAERPEQLSRATSRSRRSTQRGANRLTGQRRPSSRSATPARRTEPQHDEAVPHSYREVLGNAREDAAVVVPRRARRRAHRVFRLTPTTALVGTVLFGQLIAALWLKALAVSASHRTDGLVKSIADTEAEIDKTQRKISVISSDPKMDTWAAKLGYRAAQQTDLDDVSSRAPLVVPQETPDGAKTQ